MLSKAIYTKVSKVQDLQLAPQGPPPPVKENKLKEWAKAQWGPKQSRKYHNLEKEVSNS